MGDTIRHAEFWKRARMRPTAFTRQRQVNLVGVVSIILNMIRRSTPRELDDYLSQAFPEEPNMTYTQQSFAEARQNLRPEAFEWLNQVFLKGFYEDDDEATYRGFRLLAIDGSVIAWPNTPALRAAYGVATNQFSQGAVARARSSSLYDVLNGIVVHSILGRYDTAERDMAKTHLTTLADLPGSRPNLVLFDRGYPSADLIWWLLAHAVRFVMRVPTGFYREIEEVTEPDSWVTIRMTSERARALTRQGIPVPVGTVLTVRVLKLLLPSGDVETLITDLTPAELPLDEALDLYFLRWGVETHDDDGKYKWEVENFSGQTPVVIQQDFHASILMSNRAAVAEQDAQAEIPARIDPNTHKYVDYRINRNILIGKMKDRLIAIALEEDGRKREAAWNRLRGSTRRKRRAILNKAWLPPCSATRTRVGSGGFPSHRATTCSARPKYCCFTRHDFPSTRFSSIR